MTFISPMEARPKVLRINLGQLGGIENIELIFAAVV